MSIGSFEKPLGLVLIIFRNIEVKRGAELRIIVPLFGFVLVDCTFGLNLSNYLQNVRFRFNDDQSLVQTSLHRL